MRITANTVIVLTVISFASVRCSPQGAADASSVVNGLSQATQCVIKDESVNPVPTWQQVLLDCGAASLPSLLQVLTNDQQTASKAGDMQTSNRLLTIIAKYSAIDVTKK